MVVKNEVDVVWSCMIYAYSTGLATTGLAGASVSDRSCDVDMPVLGLASPDGVVASSLQLELKTACAVQYHRQYVEFVQ